jgi:hypothetical protein
MSGDMASAKRVKEHLTEKYGAEPWFVKLSWKREDGVGWYVRVTVRRNVARPVEALPPEIEGVTIRIHEVD